MVIVAAGECLISAACCRRRTCWRWKWHHCKCCFAMEGYCCRAALSCIEWLSLVLHSLISLALLGLACACYFYGDAFSSVIRRNRGGQGTVRHGRGARSVWQTRHGGDGLCSPRLVRARFAADQTGGLHIVLRRAAHRRLRGNEHSAAGGGLQLRLLLQPRPGGHYLPVDARFSSDSARAPPAPRLRVRSSERGASLFTCTGPFVCVFVCECVSVCVCV